MRLPWCWNASSIGLLACASVCFGQQTPVILVSIDTLRADRLSAYGYQRIHTPHIDSYGQNGTVFANADSQIPCFRVMHASQAVRMAMRGGGTSPRRPGT